MFEYRNRGLSEWAKYIKGICKRQRNFDNCRIGASRSIKCSHNALETITISVTDRSKRIDRTFLLVGHVHCTVHNYIHTANNISGPRTGSSHSAFVAFTVPSGLCSRFAYLDFMRSRLYSLLYISTIIAEKRVWYMCACRVRLMFDLPLGHFVGNDQRFCRPFGWLI